MRVLVLYCEEGEGHASAARAIAAELEAAGVEAVVEDALQHGLGRLIAFFSRDAYRIQVRWLRWTYGLEYAVFTRFPPARALARAGLAWLGGRPLRRVIERHQADLVVSTHPAVTNVVGHLRRRGLLGVPAVATVTDFGVHALWAHRGIDLHLVMHERSRPAVERVAGPGSARVVAPIVGASFRSPRSQREARRALGLPEEGAVAVISGGGWGVGDVEQAARAALTVPGLTVVCLCGRNDALRWRLERRLGRHERLRIAPFTNRMPELLAAADVLVDSTVGVTCLEAFASGCRVIPFGAPRGHSRENARALKALGLAELPRSSAELAERLSRLVGEPRPRSRLLPARGDGVAGVILAAQARVRARRSRRPAVVGVLATTGMLVFTGWTFASPDPYPLVARAFDLAELSSVVTPAPEVGLVVEAPSRRIPATAQRLSALGIHASFVVSRPPPAGAARAVLLLGDGFLPAISPGGATGMLRFRTQLRALVDSLALGGRFYYLGSPLKLTLGDYLIAKAMGGRPIAPGSSGRLVTGAIVLVDARRYTDRRLAAVAARLSSRGLRAVPIEELVASAASTRAIGFALVRASAPPPTSRSDRTSTH